MGGFLLAKQSQAMLLGERTEAGKLGVHSRPELDRKTPVGVEGRGQGQASFEELMPLEAAPVYASSCSYMLASLPHMCTTHVGT